MKTMKCASLRVRAAGGSDGDGGGDGPAIVLSHGFGAPGDDLVSLWRVIDAGRDVRWFFPEAPLEVDVGGPTPGRAWWPIDMAKIQLGMMRGERRQMAESDPPEIPAARASLSGALDALVAEHRLDTKRTLLGGFSQGAMLSTELLLHRDDAFAGLIVLSGSILAAHRWGPRIDARAKGLRVFQSHGDHDPILPFDGAKMLHDRLVAAGAEVELVGFRGQHEIPPIAVQRLGAFAQRVFAG